MIIALKTNNTQMVIMPYVFVFLMEVVIAKANAHIRLDIPVLIANPMTSAHMYFIGKIADNDM